MPRIICLLLILLCLSACTYSVEQLVRDESLRVRVIKDCLAMGMTAKDETNCQNAARAQVQVTGEKVMDLLK